MNVRFAIFIGYDYSFVFEGKDIPNNIYCIVPKNEEFLSEEARVKLKKSFKERYIEVLYNAEKIKDALEENKIDVLISFGWRRIISEKIIESVDRAVNVHPAILPDYKGYHPLPHVILNNEKEHGITAHILTNELDAGEILFQERFEINEFSTIKSLQAEVMRRMTSFFWSLVNAISDKTYTLTSNRDEDTKIIAGRRTPEDSKIDSSKSLDDLYNEIRSCDVERFPAFFIKNGQKVYVKLWREDKVDQDEI